MGLESEVARLRQSDPEALGRLLDRYQHRLYRYLCRLVRNPQTAEDLFQQTWVRVIERIRQYDPSRSFEAWLFSVARNLAIDHLRRRQPEALDEPMPSGATRGERLAADAPSSLDLLLARERDERLAEALAGLSAIYSEVLTLRFEEEMKLEEIAQVLEAPLSTVKTRLRRAIEALRRTLEARPGASIPRES
ncbi:MAG TPA: sigma-70 family RNA polymerase sigma factor [Candidatus Acidoferrales bacterium]|nr:sigma-70 family RNA polymerase sigma factor [Candidatus Acidoferrales bacterium]